MHEDPPDSLKEKKEHTKREIIALGKELSERREVFPFPGIEPEAFANIQAADLENPGYSTPIDEILARCRAEGVKVVLGADPANVFILPARSNDLLNDNLFPRHLRLEGATDARLRKLIFLGRQWKELCKR